MNLKFFEVALERTSKNLIILHCYCGPGTSKNLRLHLREPQKTPGLLGTRTSNSFQGSFRLMPKQVFAQINAEHDVAGLCRELPDRVAKLDELEGGRLPK